MQEENEQLKIGDLLLKENFLDTEQLEAALIAQERDFIDLPLGEVCIRLKFISRDALRKLLRKYQANIHIGELLINMHLIKEEQLEEALGHQSVMDTKLGDTLIDLEYITASELTDAISIQLGYPKIIPNIALIDKTLLKGLSISYMKANKFIPAFKEEGHLTVIMANPLDEQVVGLVKDLFKCEIEIAVASAEDIIKAIDLYDRGVEFGPEESEKSLIIGDIDLSKSVEGDSVVDVVNFIITNAIIEEASDIHIELMDSKIRVRYRIDGILHQKTDLPKSMGPSLASRIKVLCKLDIAEKRRHQDGRIEARVMNKEVDLRISTYASLWGESIVIRILPRTGGILELEMLGFTPANLSMFRNILDVSSGIVLVTGPTGSGKTTTLYAAIDYLQEENKKIITAEDPIEYTIDGVVQGQINKNIGQTYIDFLKSMLRQDPDVIMIGEIRDRGSAEAVVEAALTGHKVLTTFHTDDTTGALLRLLEMGIETFLISSTIVSVISQRLVRTLCIKCKHEYEPEESEIAPFRLINFDKKDMEDATFYEPRGCHYCRYTGYKGRIAIHEVLRLNDAIRDDILKKTTTHKVRETARQHGNLISMREDGFYKASMGITSLEELLRLTPESEVDNRLPRDFAELKALCEGVR
ncbi:MAG: Flp pilus assembly complex ATPase component TadA [Proteobacteria bacterium]|nr:Flp pilus assembly complex ATPase component TadA [Pseudomonadota bacterium]